MVSAPRIADAPISFECVVDRIIPMPPLPDHVVWGRVKRIHVRDDLYLPNGRIDVGALGVFGRLAAEYTLVNNIFTTPLPEELVEELGCATRRTARRARDRLFTHRHDRMVTVGLDDGGSEMTTGAPTLLMIHGFLDDATVWDGVIGSLAGELAAVRYDLPGFGARSGAVADACSATLESLAAEAGDFIAGIDGPVIVVGQSLGTQVAELVAAQHADQVRGLVLLTPVPLGGTQTARRRGRAVSRPGRRSRGATWRASWQLSPHLERRTARPARRCRRRRRTRGRGTLRRPVERRAARTRLR